MRKCGDCKHYEPSGDKFPNQGWCTPEGNGVDWRIVYLQSRACSNYETKEVLEGEDA